MNLDGLSLLQGKSNFIFYVSSKFPMSDISYREEGEKWATLRYYTEVGGEKLRVKEFFLDWFYTGFPKSLMNSFVSTYSKTYASRLNGNIVFIGRNYKGMQAASSFLMGTQVEIEGGNEHSLKKFHSSLVPVGIDERFRNMSFINRSFFARNGHPEWFEEERIHRLSWSGASHLPELDDFVPDSIGVLRQEDRVINTIAIYRTEFFSQAIWLDISSTKNEFQNAFYELRSGEGLFDFLEMEHGLLAFIDDSGPALYQEKNDEFVVTISFSDIMSFSKLNVDLPRLREIVSVIEKKYF
jgi:hypothetical protein